MYTSPNKSKNIDKKVVLIDNLKKDERGLFHMLNKEMWKVFKKTGNIEAYLYYKQYHNMVKSKEGNGTPSNMVLSDAVKINSL